MQPVTAFRSICPNLWHHILFVNLFIPYKSVNGNKIKIQFHKKISYEKTVWNLDQKFQIAIFSLFNDIFLEYPTLLYEKRKDMIRSLILLFGIVICGFLFRGDSTSVKVINLPEEIFITSYLYPAPFLRKPIFPLFLHQFHLFTDIITSCPASFPDFFLYFSSS